MEDNIFERYTQTREQCLVLIRLMRCRRTDDILKNLFGHYPELMMERHQDIADLIGQSREAVTRGFIRLRRKDEQSMPE